MTSAGWTPGPKVSRAEEAAIIALHQSGATYSAIGRAIGRPRGTISSVLARLIADRRVVPRGHRGGVRSALQFRFARPVERAVERPVIPARLIV